MSSITDPHDAATPSEATPSEAGTAADAAGLAGIRPLPVWFFASEGIAAGAWDFLKADSDSWMILAVLAAINIVIGVTVFAKRRKLLKAMLKNNHTRAIFIGLVALRLGLHVALNLVGAPITTVAGHWAMAALMTTTTVGLLWFDQRTCFRALGLTPARS
ncbi:hypothetical protein [Streptomyces sp. RKAG337]|uniref:hypothetical protein n=1 Tax=Streptomyces sp. RKAG337 TaxID=2893404 RepID=UPI00203496BA|nr:hypothetical protein [Streptomyces sp. RKAG337]MCM2430052.1 hypothetical protein [Streptomyces sp. RKAG337]